MLKQNTILKRILSYILQADKESEWLYQGFCRLLRKIGKANSLLDVGAADGKRTLQYAKVLNIPLENIIGIEVGENYIKQLKKTNMHVTVLDLEKENFPFEDQKFEVVTCNQVLEHIKNIWLILQEMERVLRIGGYLVVGIPNLAALHNRILLSLGLQPLCNAIYGPHIRCFTHKAFLNMLTSNSCFRLIAKTGSSLYPFPYPLVKYGAYIFSGLSSYTFYLLKKVAHNPQETSWRMNSIYDSYYGDIYK